jgi:spore coat polysaccharide biosynthesis protein SpsF
MLFVSANETNNLVARHQEIVSHFPTNATIVRIPGDNPCVDPDEIDRIIDHYDSQWQPIGPWLYTNLDRNILGNGYPGGLGAEVYSPWFMHWLATNVETAEHREHPHKWAFDTGHVHTITAPAEIRRPQLRFDVNTPEDLDYIRDIYAHVYPVNPNFRTKDILQYLDGKGANDG